MLQLRFRRRPQRRAQCAVRPAGARAAAISGDLGPPAADQDPGRPALKRGSTGKRVELLRQPLGLSPAGGYDEQLFQAVAAYQTVHGLGPADGIAGKATIASLNRGSIYYARRIAINMERAYRLPAVRTFDRYVVVDSGAAEAYLFDRDRIADRMKVVVGAPKTKTPMMAVIMRNAKANPYWNVPPELVRSLTAKKDRRAGPLLPQETSITRCCPTGRPTPRSSIPRRSTGRRSRRARSEPTDPASASCRGRGIRCAT